MPDLSCPYHTSEYRHYPADPHRHNLRDHGERLLREPGWISRCSIGVVNRLTTAIGLVIVTLLLAIPIPSAGRTMDPGTGAGTVSQRSPAAELAAPADRVAARLAYARAMLAAGRAAEARGALAAIAANSPIDAGARGTVLLAARVALRAGRFEEAQNLAAGLPQSPTACGIALVAAERLARTAALPLLACAAPLFGAAGASDPPLAHSVRLATARILLVANRPVDTLRILDQQPRGDPEMLLITGRARAAVGDVEGALGAWKIVAASADRRLSAHARIDSIALQLQTKRMTSDEALKALETLRFAWRGGEAERHLHATRFDIAARARDWEMALDAGATLLTRFNSNAFISGVQVAPTVNWIIATIFGPASNTPLLRMVDIYWTYRDVIPRGPDGDALARGVARRLAQAGLFARAADIIEHQATLRKGQPAEAVLGAHAAAWRLKENDAARAYALLDNTDVANAPSDVALLRRRLSIVAALRSGRMVEGAALIETIPAENASFRAEALWATNDFRAFLTETQDLDPAGTAGRELALMRAVARARIGMPSATPNDGATVAEAVLASEKPMTPKDVRRAIEEIPVLPGDRLLTLAWGCSARLTAELDCE
ncbi:tetratricopeptide repeat protein [Sandaracinobacteroides saxicola]|uniref:Tetratricopeptide repeat protein n=1 Tax=Sandaracinobacteroides saxicola TaxID=2759707 RepID=A0A7G5IK23_9SPHN|nr:hypothetical protein [Sandaracinobacteroides saxicola]QMW23715.1 hypothetical protein H3309_04295 [Sandaracinobacteroides saxicola]